MHRHLTMVRSHSLVIPVMLATAVGAPGWFPPPAACGQSLTRPSAPARRGSIALAIPVTGKPSLDFLRPELVPEHERSVESDQKTRHVLVRTSLPRGRHRLAQSPGPVSRARTGASCLPPRLPRSPHPSFAAADAVGPAEADTEVKEAKPEAPAGVPPGTTPEATAGLVLVQAAAAPLAPVPAAGATAINTATTTGPAPPTTNGVRDASGRPLVTTSFVDTEIRQALADLAAQSGVTIVPDSTIQGTVTAELKEVPLERALQIVLRAGGYTFAALEDYYLAGSPDPSNPNFHLLTRTEIYELKHISPAAALNLLHLPYGKYLSIEGTLPPVERPRETPVARRVTGYNEYRPLQRVADPGVATPPEPDRIAITAPPEIITRIRDDLARLDQPRTQVMLEAVVLEVSQDALKDLGSNWATRFFQFNTLSGVPNVVYSAISNSETAQLTALVQRGQARVRANPRVATAEGQTAELEVGRENYFSITTGTVTLAYNTLEVIRSGILLRITPRVLEQERQVLARIEPEVRDVTGRGPNGLPEITFRRAATNLRVAHGQSIVIGGLISEFTTRTDRKVPLLGDLPLIGRAFRGVSLRQSRTETVIVITPRILSAEPAATDAPGVQASELRQDLTDWRAGRPYPPARVPRAR